MNNELIYVYCLVNKLPDIMHITDIQGLRTVLVDNYYAVVRNVSVNDFSEENFKKHLSDLPWLEANAREHVEVINGIMEKASVIPFKFGTIFLAEERLKKFISDYSSSLAENFNLIGGKEEWAVKIYCDRKILSNQIDELSEDAAALEKQIMQSSPGKAYLLKRKKTNLIENEMDRISKNYGQKYFDKFSRLSESTSLNNLLPKEFTGREDTMILNATILVRKDKVVDFKIVGDSLIKNDGPSGFLIEATGPWPPFSFISIKEK